MGSQPEGRGKMIVTIFYPDATYGARLVGTLHRAVGALDKQSDLDPRPWRLDILEWPEMQAQAIKDVACSDIVVVPSDAAYAGSAFFRSWAETWPAAVDHRRMLLVPRRGVEDATPQRQQFVQWLQELAARKGMGFVSAGASDLPRGTAAFSYLADSAGLGKGLGKGIPELNSPLAG
jgi:hypothetical protein